jgi:hypothetical protein
MCIIFQVAPSMSKPFGQLKHSASAEGSFTIHLLDQLKRLANGFAYFWQA